ncbi:hypothetical protein MSAN_02513800 [Mycena sanguinolenta]|uniref:SWIM-type domain-containing protein n=1 Tax=Mycena sanguinolenta TaxID=230812 RepID=A0A8H6TX95_9AGAR|nr:hypothetical protein MSAN_02513800 [Mycena sanguinolenta]
MTKPRALPDTDAPEARAVRLLYDEVAVVVDDAHEVGRCECSDLGSMLRLCTHLHRPPRSPSTAQTFRSPRTTKTMPAPRSRSLRAPAPAAVCDLAQQVLHRPRTTSASMKQFTALADTPDEQVKSARVTALLGSAAVVGVEYGSGLATRAAPHPTSLLSLQWIS